MLLRSFSAEINLHLLISKCSNEVVEQFMPVQMLFPLIDLVCTSSLQSKLNHIARNLFNLTAFIFDCAAEAAVKSQLWTFACHFIICKLLLNRDDILLLYGFLFELLLQLAPDLFEESWYLLTMRHLDRNLPPFS